MQRTRSSYPAEFREQIVALVGTGRSPEDLAKEFEPCAHTIYGWVRQAGRVGDAVGSTLKDDERDELRRLRKKNKQLRLERGILSKAAACSRRTTGRRSGLPVHDREPGLFPIQAMCVAFDVSRSGFYAWRDRAPCARAVKDAALSQRIAAIHTTSRQTYGAPRIHAELRESGMTIGRKRVERWMKAGGLAGVNRRRSARTTIRDERVRPALDLVDRNFYAETPNRLLPFGACQPAPVG